MELENKLFSTQLVFSVEISSRGDPEKLKFNYTLAFLSLIISAQGSSHSCYLLIYVNVQKKLGKEIVSNMKCLF